ncbi:MAG: SPOR domain-containing protein [Rickettsiales bacterium]|jgi:cell division septation protein DedD|nr:SPOR domain-containing protein [Rickettsiales bacterium]
MADKNILEENEVLEFDDDTLPELPDDNPFEEEKSKKPWLLAGIGLVAVTLVIVVVLKLTMGGKDDAAGLIEIPIEQTAGQGVHPEPDFADKAAGPEEIQPIGMPERLVEKRPDVEFNPDKPSVARPKPRPIKETAKPATATKPAAAKPAAVAQTAPKSGTWSVQVGSYPTRAAAEKGQREITAAHKSVFSGKSFAILAAVLPNGTTTYRLRVVNFQTSNAASQFCNNAKSDGVNCYVAK